MNKLTIVVANEIKNKLESIICAREVDVKFEIFEWDATLEQLTIKLR